MRTSTLTWLLLSLSAGLTIGCADSPTDEVIPPPLEIRQTFPQSGAVLGNDTFDLSVSFNRATDPGTVQLSLYPTPTSVGEIVRRSGGVNYTWFDVVLDATSSAYFWLIDAIDLELPEMVVLNSGGNAQLMGFGGFISSADTSRFKPDGTVIFALPPFGSFNPLDPVTFFSDEPQAIAVSSTKDEDPRSPYSFEYLAPNDSFVVVAILDSNDDARYDPTQDWWGYYFIDVGNPGAEIVRAEFFSAIEYNGKVDIILASPTAP